MIGLRISRRPARMLPRDQGGTALIEFAFALPILLLIYLSGYQLSDALACKRKVTATTRAVADLASQYSQLATADLNTILAISTQVMTPYNATAATIQLSQVYTDASGNTTVIWSSALNGVKLAKGSPYTLPPALKVNGTYLIVSKVVYAYTPAVSYKTVGPLTFGDTIYMSPRKTDSVTCNDCP